MKGSNRTPGGFALLADLERAMELDHIGLVKRARTYANTLRDLVPTSFVMGLPFAQKLQSMLMSKILRQSASMV